MRKNKKQQEEPRNNQIVENDVFKRSTLKDLIAPSGVDVSNIDHIEIVSNTKRFARSFFVFSAFFHGWPLASIISETIGRRPCTVCGRGGGFDLCLATTHFPCIQRIVRKKPFTSGCRECPAKRQSASSGGFFPRCSPQSFP